MSDRNESDFGAFLAGFIIGSLVGAAAALVLAPQSGEQTRSQIVERGQAWRGQAADYGNQAVSAVQDAGAQAQERISIVLDEGKTAVTHNGDTHPPTTNGENAPSI